MAKIAYITHGRILSCLNAALGLAEQLQARGHQVTFISNADLSEQAQSHGLGFIKLTAHQDRFSDCRASPVPRNPLRWCHWLRKRNLLHQESFHCKELENLLQELKCDLHLIETEFHTAILSTLHLPTPLVLHQNISYYHRHPNNPPLNSELIPSKNQHNRDEIEEAWSALNKESEAIRNKKPPLLRRLKRQLIPLSPETNNYRSLQRFAKARDIELAQHIHLENFLRPFFYRHLPIVATALRELEFLSDFDENFHHLGPAVGSHFGRIKDEDSYQRWQDFSETHLRQLPEQKLIYCSIGSLLKTNFPFFEKVIAAVKKHPEWSLVIGLGSQADPDTASKVFGKLPPQMLILPWAPQFEILAKAHCLITHCGASSIYEALLQNTPILAYSGKVLDENGNTARLKHHQLAHSGDIETDSSLDIEQKIALTLTDPEIKKNTATFQKHILRCQKDQLAAKKIEQFIN